MRQRFKVDVLDYMVTSNHVHLLLTAKHGCEISKALQFLHGSVGQKYNILKNRQGAFWSDRFHAAGSIHQGYKFPVLFAGYMLNDAGMLSIGEINQYDFA